MKHVILPDIDLGTTLKGRYFRTSKTRMVKHYFDEDGNEIREYETIKNEENKDMKLEDTIQGMTSSDYKERFIAEYNQVKIRRDKLLNIIKRYENKTLDFELTCDINLLRKQAFAMENYMLVLQERAWHENIYL